MRAIELILFFMAIIFVSTFTTGCESMTFNSIKEDAFLNMKISNIRDFGARGDGATDDYDAVNAAHTAASANGGRVFFPPGTYKLSDDLTVNANVTLDFSPGAELSIDNAKTVTINGHIADTIHQIFSGAGSVAGALRNDFVRPEWWGAVADNSTDCADAFTEAVNFAYSSQIGTVKLSAGEYLVQSALEFFGVDEIVIEGSAPALYAGNRICGTEIIFDNIGSELYAFSLSITGIDNSGVDNKTTSMVDTTKNFVDLGLEVGHYIKNVDKNGAVTPKGTITSITTTTNPNDTLNFAAALGGAADFDDGDHYVLRGTRGARGWVFRDFKMTATATAARAGICIPWGTAECRFEGIDVRGFTQAAIYMDAAFSNTFFNCKFSQSGCGVYGYGGQQNSFINCWLTQNTYAGLMISGSNYTIIHCDFEGQPKGLDQSYNPGGAPAGLYMVGDRVVSKGWLIEGNYFEAMGDQDVINLVFAYKFQIGTAYVSSGTYRIYFNASKDNVVVNWPGEIYVHANSDDNTIIHATGTITNNNETTIILQEEFGNGNKQSYSFYQSDVAANQTTIQIDILGLAGNEEILLPYAGSVLAVAVASNAARSAGTLTVDVTINGTATGLQAVLDGTNTTYHYATQSKNADTFSVGDRLGVEITTDATWAPVTADIVVSVTIEM